MFAVQFDAPGGLDVLEVREIPRPAPCEGEVLIEFAASTINPADVKIRGGEIAPRGRRPPVTLGYDLVGTIVERGAGVTGLAVGTRVVAMSAMAISGVGTWAQYVALPAGSVAEAPPGIDAAVLAQLPLAGLTAAQGIDALNLGTGHRVLVTGAAGAVGRLATGLLQARGHQVHALVRDTHAARTLLPAAAEVVTGDVPENSVDAILDTAGIDASAALRGDGPHVTVVPGSAADGAKLIITRESGAMLEALLGELEGGLRLEEPAVFPIRDIRAAHEHFTRRTGQRTALVG